MLVVENRYFFHNLFAKLKFMNRMTPANNNTKQVLLIFRSLKTYAKELMEEVLYDLIELTSLNIDRFMIANNQKMMLLTIEIALLISEHVRDYSTERIQGEKASRKL